MAHCQWLISLSINNYQLTISQLTFSLLLRAVHALLEPFISSEASLGQVVRLGEGKAATPSLPQPRWQPGQRRIEEEQLKAVKNTILSL